MKYNVLITGAGSCMGQSIFKALIFSRIKDKIGKVYFTNSDTEGAGLYFNYPKLAVEEPILVPLASDTTYLDEIRKIVKDKEIDIIYSGTQHEIFRLSDYKSEFPNVAVLDEYLLDMSLNKVKCFEFLKRHSIDIPKTQSFKEYSANPYFPVISKPDSSSASRNINLIKSFSDLQEVCNHIDEDNTVIQEYIDGDEYTCGCYLDRYSEEINTITFKRSLTKDGASGYGEVIKNDSIDNYVRDIMEKYIAENLDYGHINVQLRLDPQGNPKVFEINSRLSSTEAPKAKLGFNSVEAYFYNICLKKEYDGFKNRSTPYTKFLRYYEEVYYK